MECPALGCTVVATGAQRSTRLGEQAPSTRRDKDRPAVARVRSRPHRGIRGSWRIGANESQPWRGLTGGAEERSSALPESAVFEAGVLLLLPLRRAPGLHAQRVACARRSYKRVGQSADPADHQEGRQDRQRRVAEHAARNGLSFQCSLGFRTRNIDSSLLPVHTTFSVARRSEGVPLSMQSSCFSSKAATSTARRLRGPPCVSRTLGPPRSCHRGS